MMLMEDT